MTQASILRCTAKLLLQSAANLEQNERAHAAPANISPTDWELIYALGGQYTLVYVARYSST